MSEFIGRSPERPFELAKCLIVIAGPVLYGKTTLANVLAPRLSAPILDIDEGWRERWGSLENRPAMPEVYDHNHDRARPFLAVGRPAILVATYSWEGYHKKLKEFTEKVGTPLRVFLLTIPTDKVEKETERRLKLRQADPNNLSDVTTNERVQELYARYQPITSDTGIWVMELDSTAPPEENVEKIVASLADLRKN